MKNEPIFVTLLVVDLLEKLDIPYPIGGSFASTVYGRIRTTQDVDIIAQLKPRHVSDFVMGLGDAFYTDKQVIRSAIERRTSFNLIHLETMFKFVCGTTSGCTISQRDNADRTRF